jgi:hypothetical protein
MQGWGMKGKLIINILLGLVSTPLLAANAPIQRVDLVNMLGAGGATPTSILVTFNTDTGTLPCVSKTLAYQDAITVWAGIGQACITPVTSITVTPVAGSNGVSIYDTPIAPTYLSSSFYSTQITISQNTAPVFDSGNGSLISTGTLQVTTTSHWDKNY